ncbi:hypothetical protein D3C77_607530 [compost metagenome]
MDALSHADGKYDRLIRYASNRGSYTKSEAPNIPILLLLLTRVWRNMVRDYCTHSVIYHSDRTGMWYNI